MGPMMMTFAENRSPNNLDVEAKYVNLDYVVAPIVSDKTAVVLDMRALMSVVLDRMDLDSVALDRMENLMMNLDCAMHSDTLL